MEDDNPPQQPSPLPTTYPELSYTTIPLNTPATEIRLLELFPSADFSSPLHCRLYTTPIASPAPFKALSYAWGSDEKTHLIHVESNNASGSNDKTDWACIDSSNTKGTKKNSFLHSLITPFTRCCFGSDDDTTVASVVNVSSDVEVHGDGAMSGGHGEERGESDVGDSGTTRSTIGITSSLDCCLRHLRAIHHRDHPPPPNPHHHISPPVPPLTLWIDQLCINQSDSDEKAVQVGLMSQIYSRAKQVLIWLGPAADGSDEVMDVLAELGKEFESVGIHPGDATRVRKLATEYSSTSAEDNGGEKRKGGIGANEEKMIGKDIDGGIGASEGSSTTCGADGVVNAPGGGGDAAAGNSVEVGCRVDLGEDVDVAGTETLDGAAAVCTKNKANASTRKTVMAVAKDGAARLYHLGVSGGLQAFFRRPWFTRLWVVQEACHCADTVLVCGTKPPVSYDILGPIAVCAIYIPEFVLQGRYMPERDSVSDSSFNADIAGFRVSSWDAIRVMGDLGVHSFYLYTNRHQRLHQIEEGEGGYDLFTLLIEMYTSSRSSREAKSYRDRVYALLGLAVDVDELEIKPDYSNETSTAQILTRVAKAIIRKTKRKFPVELLYYSQFPKTVLDDRSEQLPSWVPDWRSGLEPPTYRTKFIACWPHRSVDMVPTTTAGVLGLRGYLVDTIEEAVSMMPSSTSSIWRESIELFEKLDRLWELSKQKNQPIYNTQARREEALWRVPLKDIVDTSGHVDGSEYTRAKAGFALEYHNWRRSLELYQAMDMDCDITVPGWAEAKKKKVTEWRAHASGTGGGKHYYAAMEEMIGTRLYLTKKGYIGIGPSNMQPGDVVVVFPGARIPFVLRPTSEDNTFTYVGDAYCDGIMDGEITFREERRDFFLV